MFIFTGVREDDEMELQLETRLYVILRVWTFCSRLDQELANFNPRAKLSPPLIYVNKALLEHGHSFVYIWSSGCFCAAIVKSCERDYMAHKA